MIGKLHLHAPLAALLATLAGCSSSTADLPVVENFDPARYMGKWFEIARLPNRFERGMEFVRAEYTPSSDGTIRVVNRGVRSDGPSSIVGRARLKNASERPLRGELEVSFFWPFHADYRIVELDSEYRYAVVTGSNRSYLWILSRTPAMPSEELAPLLERLANSGFDIGRLEYPRQL